MEITREELNELIEKAVEEALAKREFNKAQFAEYLRQWFRDKQTRAAGMGMRIPHFLTE